jgi:hypothetical protein
MMGLPRRERIRRLTTFLARQQLGHNARKED